MTILCYKKRSLIRLEGFKNLADPIIICNIDHRFLVTDQCKQIDINNPTILLEPIGKGTAPAIAAAALQSLKCSNNPLLLVLSADHVIQDIGLFHKAINTAEEKAQSDKLVTFGIVPTDANIGYGYIQTEPEDDKYSAMNVKSFHEKPNIEVAKQYLSFTY